MKSFVKYISITVVLALLMAVPALAAEGRAMDASNYFSYTNAYLSKVSGTTFKICFHVTGTGTMDEIGASYIQVQESSNNSSWTPVASYYRSSYPNMITTYDSVYSDYVSYTGTTGKYYRAYVEFYAMDDTGSGYKSYTTSSIKVP